MNSKSFLENIVTPLLRSSNEGDTKSETGTQLIGHAPEIAPKAYIHSIYKPLTKNELIEFKERIPKELPLQVEKFLMLANGLMLFNGEIRVFGYVPIERVAATKIHNYPPNILVSNESILKIDLFAIGWYQSDQSNVFLLSDGKVVRVDEQGDVMSTWYDIENWISNEILRLSQNKK